MTQITKNPKNQRRRTSWQPTEASLRAMPGLKWLGASLGHKSLWSWQKNAVARGVAIGLFTAWIPMPFQMVLAVPLSLVGKGHLPSALVCVWISNPLTWVPMLAIAYEIGFLVMRPEAHYLDQIMQAESIMAVFRTAPDILMPALVGAGIMQILSVTLGYALVLGFWGLIDNWHEKHLQNKQ